MRRRLFLPLIVFGIAVPALAGGKTDWPCLHGPRRDNRSTETGLLKAWPEGGPKLLWTASDIGHGYGSIAVSAGRLFTSGMIAKETYVTALDLSGRMLWHQRNGESWQASAQQPWAVPHAGARGTPTVDGQTVYHLSDMGRLTAFEARTGKERWHLDILKTLKSPRPKYGFCESVLIHGNRLICCPGGEEGFIVALDKRTGRTLWTNTKIRDPIGYCSPVVAKIGDVEQLIDLSAARVLAVRPDNGDLLWEYAFGNKQGNSATDAIVFNGLVYASCGYGKGSILLRPQRQAAGQFTVEPVWTSKLLDNHHGGVLLLDGYLYGAGHEARGWTCLEFSSGRMLWQVPGKGSLTYADGKLYCLDENGTMSLLQPSTTEWNAISSFRLPSGGQGAYWAHPVVCGGRLYVRHSDKVFAYQIEPQ